MLASCVGLILHVLYMHLQMFGPEDLSKLVWAFGKQRFYHEGLCHAALLQMVSQLDRWPLSAIGNLLWGMAELQHPDSEYLDVVAAHVSTRLRNLRTSTDLQRVLGVRRAAGLEPAKDYTAASASSPSWRRAAPASVIGQSRFGSPGGFGSTSSSSDTSSSTSSSTSTSFAVGPANNRTNIVSSSLQANGLQDCRPVHEPPHIMQAALVNIAWSYVMLHHNHENMLKEALRALGTFQAATFSDVHLSMLWATHLGLPQLDHDGHEAPADLADNIKLYMQRSKAAPRSLAVPLHLHALSCTSWMLEGEWPHCDDACFTSWRYRNQAALSRGSMQESVAQVRHAHCYSPSGSGWFGIPNTQRMCDMLCAMTSFLNST